MELFGIGIGELILIVLIALIVLGPKDTVRAGRNLGRAVRRFFSSEEWRTMLQATKDIRTIPDKLLEETGLDHPEEFLPSEEEIRKEAGLDDLERDMAQWKADLDTMRKGNGAPATGAGAPGTTAGPAGTPEQENRILPPSVAQTQSTQAASQPPQKAARPDSGLQDLEAGMSEWKADLSAWGSSPVIIPIPAAAAQEAAEETPPAAETSQETANPGDPSAAPAEDSPTPTEQESK